MAEGVSFLVLLGIAMPLKYAAGIVIAVKIAGWIHGALFIAFMYSLIVARAEAGWDLKKTAGYLVAALLPFGPFVVDRRLRDDEAAVNLS